jgi:hypothetical protein
MVVHVANYNQITNYVNNFVNNLELGAHKHKQHQPPRSSNTMQWNEHPNKLQSVAQQNKNGKKIENFLNMENYVENIEHGKHQVWRLSKVERITQNKKREGEKLHIDASMNAL